MGSGTGSFETCCYSVSYKSVGSRPTLFLRGWELRVLQVVGNQLIVNGAVPNLGKPVSGQGGRHVWGRVVLKFNQY